MSKKLLGFICLFLVAFSFPGLTSQAVPSINLRNNAPTIVSVTPPASASPTSGTTTAVAITAVVSDANGYNDITSVTVQIIKSDGTTNHISAAAMTFSSGSGQQATYTKSVNMNYYDAAATGASNYKVKVTVTDRAGATANNAASMATYNYNQLAAAISTLNTVNFGSINPGNSGSIQSVSIQNGGNIQIDAQVTGTDLTRTGGGTLTAGNVAWSLASDLSGSSALTTSTATITSFDLAAGSGSSKTVYWRATVPTGLLSGTYSGTITVGAVAG